MHFISYPTYTFLCWLLIETGVAQFKSYILNMTWIAAHNTNHVINVTSFANILDLIHQGVSSLLTDIFCMLGFSYLVGALVGA
jgi:hypothetical protein